MGWRETGANEFRCDISGNRTRIYKLSDGCWYVDCEDLCAEVKILDPDNDPVNTDVDAKLHGIATIQILAIGDKEELEQLIDECDRLM